MKTRMLPDPSRSICADFNAAIIRAMDKLNPALVVLNAHWQESDQDLMPEPDLTAAPGQPNLRRALQQTVDLVGKRPVCVVMDVPVLKYNPPYAIAMAHRRGISSETLRVDAAEAAGQYGDFERQVRVMGQLGLVRVADPKKVLCAGGACAMEAGGEPLYRDMNHLSPAGARYVSSALESCFTSK
jgi:hypothetical protein